MSQFDIANRVWMNRVGISGLADALNELADGYSKRFPVVADADLRTADCRLHIANVATDLDRCKLVAAICR